MPKPSPDGFASGGFVVRRARAHPSYRLGMRLPLIAVALAFGCSSSSPSTDAGQDSSRPDLCVCPDVPPVEDVVAVPDANAPDAEDAAVHFDAVDAVSVADDAPDASLPADVVAEDRPADAAVGVDAGDAVAVAVDAPEDAVDAAVGVDAPDVVQLPDVASDTGPVDAGPVSYDLDAVRTALEVRIIGRGISAPPGSMAYDCAETASNASCTVTGDSVSFSVRACFTDLTGLIRLGDAGASVVSIAGGAGSAAMTVRVTAGSRTATRQSLRVQIAAESRGGAIGLTGSAGRSTDPALADLWLLGCDVR